MTRSRPPLLGLKEEKRLELYAASTDQDPLRFVKSFPIRKASGHAGPKLARR